MNLLNIPGLTGLKTIIGSWAQIIAGLLLAIGQFLNLLADCVNGVAMLDACFDQLPLAFLGIIAAANGLSQLGIGHKVERMA